MKRIIFRTMVFAGALMMAGTLGCASVNMHSGFLSNYSELSPGPEGGVKERYIRPGVDFAKYDKVMLDKPQFFLASDADYKGIDADDMKELDKLYREETLKALGTAYPVVGDPAPDALRVRVAITNLKPNKPALSTVSSVTPIGIGINILSKAAGEGYPGAGDTGIEVQILDSTTNQELAAAVDYRQGGKFSSFTRWGSAKEAFEFWAGRLKMFLDQAHGIAPKQ